MNNKAFGNPDGSKGSFQERISEFVELDAQKFPNGISATDDMRSIRVVVGKKGSGKTLYLRRLQDSTRQDESVFSADLTDDIPGTDLVCKFCQRFETDKLDEAWEKAWRIAIFRSCISYLITKKYFTRDYSTLSLVEHLKPYAGLLGLYNQNYPHYFVERTIYSELTDIIYKFEDKKSFMKYCQNPAWDDIQKFLASTLKNCPPIFFYLDGMDEEFSRAPMEWLRCQKGLFNAVMRLARKHNSLSARLHVVIAIRDSVYLSILETSESRERYRNTPEISILDWDYSAIKYFLSEKIRQIPPGWGSYTSISDFIGLDKISPSSRQGGEECIDRYLIRHTRLLPRDIVQLGNQIADKRVSLQQNLPKDWLDIFKRIVSENSRAFADEQILISANQLASHDAPPFSAKHGYSEWYTSTVEYTNSRRKPIEDFIRYIGYESFNEEKLVEAGESIKDQIASNVNMGTVLWQNGLIGVKRKGTDPDFEFCNLTRGVGFSIPQGCVLYAFHPSLIDAINGIRVNLNVAPGGVNV